MSEDPNAARWAPLPYDTIVYRTIRKQRAHGDELLAAAFILDHPNRREAGLSVNETYEGALQALNNIAGVASLETHEIRTGCFAGHPDVHLDVERSEDDSVPGHCEIRGIPLVWQNPILQDAAQVVADYLVSISSFPAPPPSQ